ncbi:hypothetical protein [Luteibacter sp. CQ10]|uniref:hypothetical protein n=1 Tax=Luteibacter sp. CQ10 TaxID=2805821 RepID=UPI0034A4E6B0
MKNPVRAVAFGASLLLTGAAFAQVPPPAPSQQVPPPPPGEATPPPPGAMPPPASPADMPPPPPTHGVPPATTQAPDPSMPPPASNAPPPPPPPPGGMESGTTSGAPMNTPQGQVTVNSGPAPAKPAGPAPDWATLSGGKSSVTEKQASAYPLLANDFQYADSNHDGKISKAEYTKWVAHSGAGQ